MAKLDVPVVAIRGERNTPIVMRDGTMLRADMFRTDSADSHPVLLIRTPYGEPMVRTAPVLPAIEAGFAPVVQHCRGTGASDGEFVAFESETADGVDTIDLIATSQVFKAGHRLRVDVASSNFPCFDRNPGNGAPAATATEADFIVAEQTIRHDAEHPSYITLPVIPRSGPGLAEEAR